MDRRPWWAPKSLGVTKRDKAGGQAALARSAGVPDDREAEEQERDDADRGKALKSINSEESESCAGKHCDDSSSVAQEAASRVRHKGHALEKG